MGGGEPGALESLSPDLVVFLVCDRASVLETLLAPLSPIGLKEVLTNEHQVCCVDGVVALGGDYHLLENERKVC